MANDTLAPWERWPVAALFVAQGAYVFEWYTRATLPPEVRALLPWLVTAAGVAAFVAIDGAMIATVAGMRAGRRSQWSVAAIVLTAAFGAAVALDLHGALAVGAWLHAGFALTIAAYLLHLAQPRSTDARIVSHRAAQLRHLVRRLVARMRQERILAAHHVAEVRALGASMLAPDAPASAPPPAYTCVRCGAGVKSAAHRSASGKWGCEVCKRRSAA